MADDNATLNTDTGAAGSEAGESSTSEENVKLEPSVTADGYVSTVDFEPAETKSPAAEQNTDSDEGKEAEAAKPGDEEKGAKAGEEKDTGKETGKEDEAGDNVPFHKHPRWQELQADRKADQAKIQELERKLSEREEKPPEQLEVKPVESEWSKLDQDEREDLLEDDPEKYHRLLHEHTRLEDKARVDAEAAQQAQKELEEKQIATYEKYGEENKDFASLWDEGKIQAFMKENPGHNAISAHMVLTHEARTSAITEQVKAELAESHKAEIAKAVKAAVADYKAKVDAGTAISGVGGELPAETETDPKLQNTNPHGGLVAAIASRLSDRRTGTTQ